MTLRPITVHSHGFQAGRCCWEWFATWMAIAGAAFAAEPGRATFFTEGFDDAQLLERGWYDGERFAIDAAPQPGGGCIRFHWNARTSVPDRSDGVRRLFPETERVYLRFRMRLSKDWGWTGRGYHPHLLQFLTTENAKYHGPAASRLTLYVEPWEGRLRLGAQDIQNKDAPHGLTQGPLKGGFNGALFDSEEKLFTDDAWHTVEAEFRLNGLDLAADKPMPNGVVRGWCDGALVIDRKDVVLRSTDYPEMQINQLLLKPYFGPGLLPHEQTLWIDALTIAAERPADADSGDANE
jgi:hypothetical protein